MSSQQSAIRFEWEELRSVAFGAIGANYTAITPAFQNEGRIMIIKNLTDQAVLISGNGVNNGTIIPAGSAESYDLTTNRSEAGGTYVFSANSYLYVKHNGVAPTTGSLYITYCFAD
jgi:hypothetical protein